MAHYIDRKEAHKSYRPVSGTMSPGLRRAREPFRVKNAILGLSLAAFAVGVWAYSISAVKQDIFDDVDEEAEALASTGTGTSLGVGVLAKGAEEEKSSFNTANATGVTLATPSPMKSSVILEEIAKQTPVAPQRASRGLLLYLDNTFPRLLHPTTKTLVWGAPPIDNIGKISRQ